MNARRLPMVVVALVMAAGLLVIGTDAPASVDVVFARPDRPATPAAPFTASVTESWFCPGVPAAGSGLGGEIVIANPSASPIEGRLTVLRPDGTPILENLTVAAFDRATVNIGDLADARFVGAMVEIDGGPAIVEQRAIHPAGTAVAPCSTSMSKEWYFADGFTVGGSLQHLVMTNPSPGRAIVNIGFVTRLGARSPTVFQGYVIPGESVRVIDLGQVGVQDEPLLAVEIQVTSGRIVAGRSQHLIAGGRLGYTMTLGAPSLDDQWWFADGEVAAGITETYVIYNPTDDDVAADLVFLGIPVDEGSPPLEPVTLQVPANSVVTFDTSAAGLPAGRHGAVVSTLTSDSVVVERVLTRPAGALVATTVQMGSQSAFVGSRWHAPVGTALAIEDALVVMNVSFAAGTITVNAWGPGGERPVPQLSDIELPANGIVTIDIPEGLVGAWLTITTDVPVVVERRPERATGLAGRTSALGIPQR
jgi:hypothetical protein